MSAIERINRKYASAPEDVAAQRVEDGVADQQASLQRCDHPQLELWLGEQAADPAADQAGAQSVQMSSAGAALGVWSPYRWRAGRNAVQRYW